MKYWLISDEDVEEIQKQLNNVIQKIDHNSTVFEEIQKIQYKIDTGLHEIKCILDDFVIGVDVAKGISKTGFSQIKSTVVDLTKLQEGDC